MTPGNLHQAKQACPARAKGSDLSGSSKQYNKPIYGHTLLIRNVKKLISPEDDIVQIYSALDYLKNTKRLNVTEIKIEKGKFRNHLHALILSHKKSMYAKMFQLKGFYIGIQKRRSETLYRSYTMKEQHTEDWYKENYGFSLSESSE